MKDIGNTRRIALVILGGRVVERRPEDRADPTKRDGKR
jgi:hypothetical protein